MTTTRDVNLGTLIPIGLFLVAQTLGAVWWAATMTSRFDSLERAFTSGQSAVEADLEEETASRIEDRRRIYDRLVDAEQAVASITAESRATRAILDGVDKQLAELRTDIRTNNDLLRNVLVGLNVPQKNN